MKKSKHLALNVPVKFHEHVEYARTRFVTELMPYNFRRNSTREEFLIARYRRCFEWIFVDADEATNAYSFVQNLEEIEVRFIALQMTVDQSIPVKPLYNKYNKIRNGLMRKPVAVSSDENDLLRNYTLNSLGYKNSTELPSDIQDFRNAKTLAEKALIADVLTENYLAVIDEITSHFDYKRQAFGKGSRPTYGLIYLVLSLANIFEEYSDKGTLPLVSMNQAPKPDRDESDQYGQYRYTGDFLYFVEAFVWITDPSMLGNARNGFYDRVRKIAQARTMDEELPDLLHRTDVSVEVFLEFMARADALKG